jgi:hypothetical protein
MQKLLFLVVCFICVGKIAFAQPSVSYYPITSYVGVSTNTSNRLWGDFRLQTNTFVGFSTIELSPKINLKRTEAVKTYIGLGVNLNIAQGSYNNQFVNGYFISGGVMATPVKTVRQLSFIFEISPYVNYSFSDGIIRTTLGVGWQFRKKHKDGGIKAG